MFNCDNCGTVLVLDYMYTGNFYDDNVTTVLNEDGEILYENLPNTVVYVCRRCGNKKLVNLDEILSLIKTRVCNILLNTRLGQAHTVVDKQLVDEASGISFCGACSGVIDSSGYCYNDVIKQCPVRKILDDKKHFTNCEKCKE